MFKSVAVLSVVLMVAALTRGEKDVESQNSQAVPQCEGDLGDSCGLVPCCPPMACSGGKCQPPCTREGSPCNLGDCCRFRGEACQFNPVTNLALCRKCVKPFGLCNPAIPAHFIGSCCFGFTCQNFVCLHP